MLVVGFPALAFGTNCWVVAPAAGEECVVVDPGIGVLDDLAAVLREHRLRPAAVLATHGHGDHVYSVTPVCGAHGVALHIHGDDAYRLRDPLGALGPQVVAMLEQQFGATATWTEPADVRPIEDGDALDLAGLTLTVDHAPGHTEGSVMFRLPVDASTGVALAGAAASIGTGGELARASQLCLSGDVLFAGSIGRSDLAGGDPAAMERSLATKVLPLPDDVVVLPGHGPRTSIGRERATNPYLRGLVGHTAG